MSLRPSLVVLAALVLAAAQAAIGTAAEPNRLSAEELDDGWILLFDGETDFGWKANSKADWKVVDGVISVGSGEKGLLATTGQFGDFVLKVDFRNPAGTNSGIFLRTPKEPKDPAADCYELNIAEPAVSPFPTGSFVNRKKAEGNTKAASDELSRSRPRVGTSLWPSTANACSTMSTRGRGRAAILACNSTPEKSSFATSSSSRCRWKAFLTAATWPAGRCIPARPACFRSPPRGPSTSPTVRASWSFRASSPTSSCNSKSCPTARN